MNHQFFITGMFAAVLLCAVNAWSEQKTLSLAEAKAAYSQADHDLNQAYQQAKARLTEPQFDDLRKKQRTWIGYRDFQCGEVIRRDNPELEKADLTQTAYYWQRMSEITVQRTAILQSIMASRRNGIQPLGGQWTDGMGGYLDIVEQDGRFAFEIQVERGPTHHTGGVAGYAAVNGDLARFDDGGENDGKGYVRKPAWLTFIRRDDHIELLSANAQYYCGARAYFEGDYYRVGDLSEADRDRVLKSTRQGTPAAP